MAAALLRRGELVAFPTETVYGLGANALMEAAVRRVYEAKQRPMDNPMILHLFDIRQAVELMQHVPPLFEELANEFWPGPLTLIVHRNAAIPDIVTAGLDTVALRIPDHILTRELLRLAGLPIAAPSANISGRTSPTSALAAYDYLAGSIAAVLDGGECIVGIESTVLDITSRTPTILRPGTVTREDIEDVVQTRVDVIGDIDEAPRAPGTKYRHYAPRADFVIVPHDTVDMRMELRERIGDALSDGRIVGLLAPACFAGSGERHFFSLGAGVAADYARLMYAGLHSLDTAGADIIFCPGIAAEGIGYAVMNRLEKMGKGPHG